MAVPDLVGFVVKDMAASLKFYRLLGMEIPPQADRESHVEAIAPGGFRIAWDTVELVKSFNPHWVEPVGNRMGMAFLCESPAEVHRLFQRAREAGYAGHKEPWDAFWGQRYAILVDPDGNLIDLFAPLAD